MDSITVVTAFKLLAKRWYRDADGELKSDPYDNAKNVILRVEPVADIHDLAQVLDSVGTDPHRAVIRGEPKPGVAGTVSRRLSKDNPDGAKATIDAKPRHWLLLDFDDGVPLPDWGDCKHPEPLVLHLVSYLPPAFADVTCWWSFTASMGLKPGLRMRLAFWLDRPLSGLDLKTWLRDAPVDRSLFGDNHLTYVAAPVFDDPADDPFRDAARSGLLPGASDVVATPTAEALQPIKRLPATAKTGGASIDVPAGTWSAALENMGDGPGRSGCFHDHIRTAIGRYFQQYGSKAETVGLRTALADAIRSAPRDPKVHDAAYIAFRIAELENWIDWTRDAQATTEAQAAALASNAEHRWTGQKTTLKSGRDALDTWLSTFFCFNHPDAKDVRAGLKAHGKAMTAWGHRRGQWNALADFSLDADIFAEAAFPEEPPIAPDGFERVGLRVTAGVGKTRAAVRELAARVKAHGERGVYSVPDHPKAAEIHDEFEKHDVAAEIWRGFEYPAGDPACSRAEEAKSLREAGGTLAELCRDCPLHPARGGSCAYQAQRAKKPDVWIVPHATLRYAPKMHDHTFDWLIVDEAYSLPVDTLRISIGDLCPIEENGRRRNSKAHEDALGKLREILTQHPKGAFGRAAFDDINSEQCNSLASSVMVDHTSPLDVPLEELARVSAINDRVKRQRTFLTLLGAFLASDRPESGRLSWTGSEVVMQLPGLIAHDWLQAHVLVLDATLDATVARRWLPDLNLWVTINVDVDVGARVRFVKEPPVTFAKIVPSSPNPDARRSQKTICVKSFIASRPRPAYAPPSGKRLSV